MCQYSAVTDKTRDVHAGEDLAVTRAPHGCGNWLTGSDQAVAVCVPHSAVLTVQVPGGKVRGGSFIHARTSDERGRYDFIRYIDGAKEQVALNDLPLGTGVRVLQLFGHAAVPVIAIPAVEVARPTPGLVAVRPGVPVRHSRRSLFALED